MRLLDLFHYDCFDIQGKVQNFLQSLICFVSLSFLLDICIVIMVTFQLLQEKNEYFEGNQTYYSRLQIYLPCLEELYFSHAQTTWRLGSFFESISFLYTP